MVGISDPYEAFCFDEAVTEFGFSITSELDKVKGKNDKSTQGQRDALLRRLLGDGAPAATAKFRPPMATKTKKK